MGIKEQLERKGFDPIWRSAESAGSPSTEKLSAGDAQDGFNVSKGRPLDSQRHLSIEARKPWEALGMSRRTWFRRKAMGQLIKEAE